MASIRDSQIPDKAKPGQIARVLTMVEIRCRLVPEKHVERIWMGANTGAVSEIDGKAAAHFKLLGWHHQKKPELAWVCPRCYEAWATNMFSGKGKERVRRPKESGAQAW